MPTIKELASYAEASAHQLGIKKFDIYGSSVDETSVQVEQGEPKQVKASNRSSVIVRVWNENNTMGVTSTTDVDPQGVELALKTAYEASFFGVKEHVPDFSPEATAPTADVPNEKAPQAPVSTLIEKLVAVEKEVINAHPAIKAVPYNGLAQRDIDRFYLNNDGALREEARSYASIYLYSKTEQDGKKPRSAGDFKLSRGLEGLDIQGCVQKTVEKTISHLNYRKIKSGKYRVVLSADAFLSLLGAFSNLFNAQSILDKQSLSTPESLGTQIASPLLSVYDDALHPDNISAETFDGEGTPTRRVPLIAEGVLSSFLHSTGTAKRMNAEPTGHANIGAKVTVSPHFYHVVRGQPAEHEYSLTDAENVILIDDLQALHAGVNSLQGSFSLPFDGWLVEKGELTSLDSATIAGDFRELLKSIIFVEEEAELTPGGLCPRIWVEGLSITGE
ncbi:MULTISPECIES: TldD/PmbA family protein [unclassified Coleofasciculus]|uniref:TldD/PmbA family protein n=1 Tax=unclassified Coleofasciculus TaxID=2692782 RepID=UPI001882ADAA|nr:MULTISPECIES: TldD/PmbA family protein [unclassified Coleofasciculus]MBE9127304.1 TldD/PmbA family protein [Coleofasciculus sp. LEGE 07081]MBE9150807.1 TldD/PmbA family protein [Coleofasciculus sp. LEGE 07092]